MKNAWSRTSKFFFIYCHPRRVVIGNKANIKVEGKHFSWTFRPVIWCNGFFFRWWMICNYGSRTTAQIGHTNLHFIFDDMPVLKYNIYPFVFALPSQKCERIRKNKTHTIQISSELLMTPFAQTLGSVIWRHRLQLCMAPDPMKQIAGLFLIRVHHWLILVKN